MSLADWVYDEPPCAIKATGRIGATGVDEEMSAILSYSNQRTAQIYSGLRAQTSHAAVIYGTKGHIEIHAPAHGSEAASLASDIDGSENKTVTLKHPVNGYVYEAEEVQKCLAQGQLESHNMPWNTSLRIIKILDELRTQVGVRYAFENLASKT